MQRFLQPASGGIAEPLPELPLFSGDGQDEGLGAMALHFEAKAGHGLGRQPMGVDHGLPLGRDGLPMKALVEALFRGVDEYDRARLRDLGGVLGHQLVAVDQAGLNLWIAIKSVEKGPTQPVVAAAVVAYVENDEIIRGGF
jgi:hypothetical protein